MIYVTFKLFNKIPFSLALISMQDKDRRSRDRVKYPKIVRASLRSAHFF
jgi:hypothetical protein